MIEKLRVGAPKATLHKLRGSLFPLSRSRRVFPWGRWAHVSPGVRFFDLVLSVSCLLGHLLLAKVAL